MKSSVISTLIPLLLAVFVSAAEDPFETKTCQPINVDMCKFSTQAGYTSTKFPHGEYRTQDEVKKELSVFSPLLKVQCHKDTALFLCSHYVPLCLEAHQMTLKPCRSLCESVKIGCSGVMKAHGFEWPFNCTELPGSGEICVAGTTPPSTSTTTIAPNFVSLNGTTVAKPTNKTKGKSNKKKRGKVTGAEGSSLEIKCKKGQMVVIKKVSHKNSQCCPDISKQILSVMCHRKKTCRFDVSQNTFGGHCMGKIGSVAVKYKCEKNRKNNKKQGNEGRCPKA